MYRNSFVLWFCMSQSYPVEFLQTWNQQICLNLSKPSGDRQPSMGWRYSRVTIAPGINDRDMVQERFLTKLPDQWLEVAKTWKKRDLVHRWEWKIGTWKCFDTKKIELELSRLWWKCFANWLSFCLLPKISYKDSRMFRSGSPRNGYAILMSSCSNEIAASLGKPDSWSCVSQVCCTDVMLIS